MFAIGGHLQILIYILSREALWLFPRHHGHPLRGILPLHARALTLCSCKRVLFLYSLAPLQGSQVHVQGDTHWLPLAIICIILSPRVKLSSHPQETRYRIPHPLT